ATAGATTAQVVSFTATVAYNTAYNTAARSATFSYLFQFGDGQIATLPGTSGLTGTVTHKYAQAGTYPVVVIVQETASNALAKIQEVGRFSQPITGGVSPLCPAATPCTITFAPTNPTVGQSITFTANVNGGTTPYTFSWNFGDGSALGTTNPVSHSYAVKGTFTVTLTITDSSTPTHQTATVTATVTVTPLALAVAVAGPTTGTTGTAVTFTATGSGGT